MYKHTRKKAIKQIYKQPLFTLDKSELMSLISNIEKDLLAQKEDRKECKHEGDKTDWHPQFCRKCGAEFMYDFSTPSPLEIEDIEEIHKDKNITVNFATKRDLALAIMKTQLKTNSLIRNQKKLYQYIKEKK